MWSVSIRDGMTQAKEGDVLSWASDFVMNAGVQSVDLGDGKVKQSGPSAAVLVQPGVFYVKNNAYARYAGTPKFYRIENDTDYSVSITANASGNPRIDLICVKIDTVTSPDAEATNIATAVAVAGTPAASPSAPAVPANHLVLAQVAVANGFATITTANITDRRTQTAIGPVALSEGQMMNGQVTRVASGNAITIAIKTMAGNDPSTDDPVYVRINNKLKTITSALSVNMPAATPRFNLNSTFLAGQSVDLFCYLGERASDGSVFFGPARISYGHTYADFSATANNEKYLAYTGAAPASGDVVVPVARVSAQQDISGNWTDTANFMVNEPTRTGRELSLATTTMVLSADGTMTYTSVTVRVAKYRQKGSDCKYRLTATGTVGGTPTQDIIAPLPFTHCATEASSSYPMPATISLGALDISGQAYLSSADVNNVYIRKSDATAWSAGAGRVVKIAIDYPMSAR
jgi:hypothetical protein